MLVFRASGGHSISEDPFMKISARTQLRGKIVSMAAQFPAIGAA